MEGRIVFTGAGADLIAGAAVTDRGSALAGPTRMILCPVPPGTTRP
jgi:hypothetical protein